MKRIGNVWDDFCSVDLIKTAIRNAAKGKRKYRKVRKVLANIDDYAEQLHKLLVDEMFSPSPYTCDIMKTEKRGRFSSSLSFPTVWCSTAYRLCLGTDGRRVSLLTAMPALWVGASTASRRGIT
jgi:hypothetical protein